MKDTDTVKKQFPIFDEYPDLIYFDSAASAQRPASVIDAMSDFYRKENANIKRGVYHLSSVATQRFEEARSAVANFIGAASPSTIAFTQGTTASINAIVQSYVIHRINPDANIVITALEHHANLIPWQQLCKASGAELRVIPVDENGNLNMEAAKELIDEHTLALAFSHISNAVGTILPVHELVELAKANNAVTVIDAAQSACFYDISVIDLDCDFLAFSGHKIFGPFGIGVLYAHPKHHAYMKPFQFGGGIVKEVSFEDSTFMEYPYFMEVGTPPVAEVVGLTAAIDYIQTLDREKITLHIHDLAAYFKKQIENESYIKLAGNPDQFSGIVSFNLDGIHAHDVATFLGEENIAVRAGHHCCQPLLRLWGLQATVRASFSHFNDYHEIDKLIETLKKIKNFFE